MSTWRTIRSAETGEVVLPRAKWCAGYWCHLRGLMFRRAIAPDEGLFFTETVGGRLATAIHMCCVPFPIGVLWLDDEERVVDKVIAKPWRLYIPRAAACAYLEGPPSLVTWVKVGERLHWETMGDG